MQNKITNYKKRAISEHRNIAKYYDEIFKKARNISFYKRYAKKVGGPILELACGTGRILIPLAKLGYRVAGLDLSEDMLAVFREKISKNKNLKKKITLIQGDMENFNLGRKFKLIFISNTSFLHLKSKKSKINALNCIARHPENGGVCIIENYPYKKLPWIRIKELEHKNVPRIFLKLDIWGENRGRDTFKVTAVENRKNETLTYTLDYWVLTPAQMKSLIKKTKLRTLQFLPPTEAKKYFGIDARDIFILGKR